MPFLGAGVSQAIGFPGWREAVLRLGRVANQKKLDLLSEQQKEQLACDALSLADRFRQAIPDPREYRQFFQKEFQCTQGIQQRIEASELWKALVKLPCDAWITLNYDCALEFALAKLANRRAVSVDWADRHSVNPFLLGDEGADPVRCIHLHGVVPLKPGHAASGDFVLTEQEYQQRYLRSDEDRSKLFVVFTARVMLFIGCSLTDLDLMGVLREVKAKLGYRGYRHYALLAYPETDSERDERDRQKLRVKYGVEPIFYQNGNRDFKGLPVLLNFLRKAVDAQPVALPLPKAMAARVQKDDPQKGRRGMTAVRGSHRLTLLDFHPEDEWCRLVLMVSGPGATARFHLHDTFPGQPFDVPIEKGAAELRCTAWGVFTVGVEVLDGSGNVLAWLELDLAECDQLPYSFRQL